MSSELVTEKLKDQLLAFLSSHRKVDLLTAYFFFLEKRLRLKPVAVPQKKLVYKSVEDAIRILEDEGELWREAEIKISFSKEAVNEETARIYICPFSGKVFGNNTHPNPLDAIYDHVSKCPENTERVGGLKVKRFFVSEDPEVIKNYLTKTVKPFTKKVFSSAISGKLFNSREAIIDDFKKSHIKEIAFSEVQGQNRFEIEPSFLAFIQEQLDESRLAKFVEGLNEYDEFTPYIQKWFEE